MCVEIEQQMRIVDVRLRNIKAAVVYGLTGLVYAGFFNQISLMFSDVM